MSAPVKVKVPARIVLDYLDCYVAADEPETPIGRFAQAVRTLSPRSGGTIEVDVVEALAGLADWRDRAAIYSCNPDVWVRGLGRSYDAAADRLAAVQVDLGSAAESILGGAL